MPQDPRQRGTGPLPRPLWCTASQSTIETAKGEWKANSETEGDLDGARQRFLQGKDNQERCRVTLMEPRPEIAEDTLVQSNVQKNELSTDVDSGPQESAGEEEGLRICRIGTTYAFEIEEEKSQVSFIPRSKYRIQTILSHRLTIKKSLEFLVSWVGLSEASWVRDDIALELNFRTVRDYIGKFRLEDVFCENHHE